MKRSRAERSHPYKKKEKTSAKETLQQMEKRIFDVDFLVGIQKCEICRKDISRSVVILCTTCSIIFCLPCLYKGTEAGEHKKTDNYLVLDSLNKSIYSSDWTAREELMMIKGKAIYKKI